MDKEDIQKAIDKINEQIQFPQCEFEFEFNGGPRDGESASSTAPRNKHGYSEAIGLWMLTKNGTVGSAFQGTSPGYQDHFQKNAVFKRTDSGHITVQGVGPAQVHRYRVADRIESAELIRILLKYDPQEVSSPA